ncbi:Prophage CP4-57 integrase [Tsuneonella dongtanensis]|uniref:Prophage CP4-57 integrase n=1 Tax=Tsuneonella dongtanensis TaxID=692370 RepID=A0A1B2ABV9_9SPHN|nr:integrase arm-type DNA-binding domain-containing protein [Tsuneonella dongtanensis]ANY19578.1 Prophage CP4-57 integrase [Tsuneonella dongtanensis]
MAREINKLNPLKIKGLSKPGLHLDGNGLYLSVSKTGAKAWVLIYYRNKKRTELGLGPFPAVSLSQAREKCQEAATLRAQGSDPKQQWRSANDVGDTTFGTVALDLIELLEAGWKNEKHRAQWRSTLKTYAKPIWDKPVDAICVDDVLAILRPIWTTKAETASRVRGRVEAVLDAAKVRGLRNGENPASWRGNLALLLPKRRKGPKQHHSAMPYDQVPAFVKRLRKLPGNSAKALELLILTAARTSEIIDADWSEFDLDKGLWTVPAERMKAGKEHRVPLSKRAVELLKNLNPGEGLVFPGSSPKKPMSNMAMAMLLRRLKCDDVTVHGFRSSFRDWAGETTTFPREIAEHALAHQVGSEVERAYRRGDALDQRGSMMEEWATFLAS